MLLFCNVFLIKNTECERSKYGMTCKSDCSPNCMGGYNQCYHVNGTCLQGCIDGWRGSKCDQSKFLYLCLSISFMEHSINDNSKINK